MRNALPANGVIERCPDGGVEVSARLRAQAALTVPPPGELQVGIERVEPGGREALEAALEAADIRRELAAARPDAFRPYLAMSLNNLANRLSQLGRREKALGAFREGIEVLAPYFLALPAASSGLMAALVRGYLQCCQELNQEPDAALLSPILKPLDDSGD